MPGKRLNQADVLEVLRGGRRLSRASFDLRLLLMPPGREPAHARMAIAVPKKLLKSAVARNRIKRVVRETLRAHPSLKTAQAHFLVTFKAKNDCRLMEARRALREELSGLFNDAARRAKSSPPPLLVDAGQ